MAATISFFGPNFNFLSVTLEHKTLTSTTESILQLLAIIAIGKLVRYMAWMRVILENRTIIVQNALFLTGILTLY